MINSSIISDRVRLGIALVRSGHTVSSAAVKASLPEAELGYWHGVAPLPWTVHGYGGSGQFMVQPFVFDGREVAQRRVAA